MELGAGPVRRPPSVEVLVGWVLAATLAVLFAVVVATQPSHSQPVRPCRTIVGLVLDGGTVTTTAPISSIGRPVNRIPRRDIGDPTTTTTEACR